MSDQKALASAGAGAALGGATVFTAVATTGSVAGLGATGVTSGLAAVGSLIGGGMVAGLAVTAAAPLLTGVAGYALYRYFSSDEDKASTAGNSSADDEKKS